jgi:4-cresol dehydrogenase (hydroxylating)
VDGLFMQSNLGIVTKMGVWLMPEPEVYLSGWARFHSDEAVGPLVDALRRLMLDGTIRNYPILNRGMSMAEGAGEGNIWALRFALYGRRRIVDAQLEVVREALAGVPGLTMGGRYYTPSERVAVTEHDDKVQGGVPGLEIFELFNRSYGDDTGHLDLSPVMPLSGREAVESIRLIRSLYGRHNLEYVAGLLFMPRCFLHITTTFYDRRDEAQVRRAYDAYGDMTRELARRGYGLYRTNLRNMDLVADLYDFNGHALRRFVETIKDAVDPAGVISPGKQGIWPRALRR